MVFAGANHPEVQVLALPGLRSLAKGESATVSAGGCFVFCFLSREMGVGFYPMPPSGHTVTSPGLIGIVRPLVTGAK